VLKMYVKVNQGPLIPQYYQLFSHVPLKHRGCFLSL